jgi:hypothetical protein
VAVVVVVVLTVLILFLFLSNIFELTRKRKPKGCWINPKGGGGQVAEARVKAKKLAVVYIRVGEF